MLSRIAHTKNTNTKTNTVSPKYFEVGQYVRVCVGAQRTEIGVVAHISDVEDCITVTTRHGYDLTIPRAAARRAFLVVLDINGVLGARGRGSFVHRPHVQEFIKFLFANFVVAVWTSGLERTSKPIMESLFHGYQNRLLFTLYRDACTSKQTKAKPYGTLKNLQRIFDTYPESFHSVNTIIIDDSPDKCSHPDIALCPPQFNIDDDASCDNRLLQVISVLKDILELDSLSPIIRVAQDWKHQHRIEEQHASIRVKPLNSFQFSESTKERIVTKEKITTPSQSTNVQCVQSDPSTEICMWKTRLCCDYITGTCSYGDTCRYAHQPDDGKQPCCRKNKCRRGHAARWEVAYDNKHITSATSDLFRQGKGQGNNPEDA